MCVRRARSMKQLQRVVAVVKDALGEGSSRPVTSTRLTVTKSLLGARVMLGGAFRVLYPTNVADFGLELHLGVATLWTTAHPASTFTDEDHATKRKRVWAKPQIAVNLTASSVWRRTMRLFVHIGGRSGSSVISLVRASSTLSTFLASTRASGAPTQ
jgi:hypothetical protein